MHNSARRSYVPFFSVLDYVCSPILQSTDDDIRVWLTLSLTLLLQKKRKKKKNEGAVAAFSVHEVFSKMRYKQYASQKCLHLGLDMKTNEKSEFEQEVIIVTFL